MVMSSCFIFACCWIFNHCHENDSDQQKCECELHFEFFGLFFFNNQSLTDDFDEIFQWFYSWKMFASQKGEFSVKKHVKKHKKSFNWGQSNYFICQKFHLTFFIKIYSIIQYFSLDFLRQWLMELIHFQMLLLSMFLSSFYHFYHPYVDLLHVLKLKLNY